MTYKGTNRNSGTGFPTDVISATVEIVCHGSGAILANVQDIHTIPKYVKMSFRMYIALRKAPSAVLFCRSGHWRDARLLLSGGGVLHFPRPGAKEADADENGEVRDGPCPALGVGGLTRDLWRRRGALE